MQDVLREKNLMLQKLYDVYGQWVKRHSLACKKGCSACCTQSVTITSLEAEAIVEFFSKKGEERKLAALLAGVPVAAHDSPMTTNQFARLCLERREIDSDDQGAWNFEPCIFLLDGICTIYEVRPFGCRSFGSLVKCEAGRSAEIVPLHLTVNTVFMQIIEHLSSSSGYWGNMVDILKYKAGQRVEKEVITAQPIPGFLIKDEESTSVNEILSFLFKSDVNGKTFISLLRDMNPVSNKII